MAIDKKYVKDALKALMDHLGCEEEGESPNLPAPDNDEGNSGSNLINDKSLKHTATAKFGPVSDGETKGKKFKEGKSKQSAMALLASNLATKFNK